MTTYPTEADQSRLRDVDKTESRKAPGESEFNRFVKLCLAGGFIGFVCGGSYIGRYPVIAPIVVVLMGCANLLVDDLLGRFESTKADTESNSSDPDTTSPQSTGPTLHECVF